MKAAVALALALALAPSTRRDLVRALTGGERECVVVVAPDVAADAARRSRLAEDVARAVRGPVRVTSDLRSPPDAPLVLVGESAELRRLASRLPLPLEKDSSRRTTLLVAHPDSPARPLVVVHGPDALAFAGRALRDVVFGEVDFTVALRGRVVRSGRFVPGTGRVDPASEVDVAARAAEFARGLAASAVSTGLVRVLARFDVSSPALRAAVARKDERLRASGWTEPVDLLLYASAEEKAAVTGSAAACDAEPLESGGTRVHVVAEPAAEWAHAEAEWLGAPSRAEAEDAATPAALRAALPYVRAGTYRGEPLDLVVRRLRAQGRLVPLADLADPERWRAHSYLFAEPSAAGLALFLRERGLRPLDAACEREWLESLGPGPEAAPPGPPRPVPFQRGVCLAHAYDIHTGYLSAGAAETVRRLRDGAGVEWISITPFGYPRAKDRPEIEPRDLSSSAAAVSLRAETDESLVAMTRSAHALGVRVAIVPHLWAHGFWCGEIAMTSDRDWDEFFASYRRFILHHAEVARRAGADLFCVGKELAGTTRARPEAWRALAAEARRVFPGPVTYAANWGEEFETVPFFDALDAAGLNLYQPLCESDATPDDATLRAAAERAAARAAAVSRRSGRPVILMEVGLPAHPLAAREPWKDPADDRVDEALQARAYRAIMSAFLDAEPVSSADRGFCAGFYWWKVFTDPRANARRPNGFPPVGKLAESVLREFYVDGKSRPR